MRMPPLPSPEYLECFREALRMEIKAEMGRRSLSAHALAVLIGENPQYVNMRLLTGNKKTGRFVDLTVYDLAKICGALDVDMATVMLHARELAEEELEDQMAAVADASEIEGSGEEHST